MPLGYELVAEIDVTSPTTQVDFTGLNFTSDDVLLIVSDIVDASNGACKLYVNANYTDTNYWVQRLLANGSTPSGQRINGPFQSVPAGDKTKAETYIKLTEGGYLTYESFSIREYDTTTPKLEDWFGTSNFILSSITQLRIAHEVANGIGTGSNFKLYKLVAEPIADITVTSDTTQVDITGLSLDETNELLLVADFTATLTSSIGLFINGSSTASNYYRQELIVNGTGITPSRNNEYYAFRVSTSSTALGYAKLKLTNNGNMTFQCNESVNLGGSGVYILNNYVSSTTTFSSITSISLISLDANRIYTGSRFKLYKLK